MSGPLSALDRWWRPAVPAERLAAFRLLVGLYGFVYLLVRLPFLMSYGRRDPLEWEPLGILSFLSEPLPPLVATLQPFVLPPLALAFLLGAGWRWVAPLYAAALLWVLTYSNCWGFILHVDNLMTAHTLVLAATPAADALSIDARRRGGPTPPPSGAYGWGLSLAAAVAVVAYVLAGVAKIENGGTAFLSGENLRNYVAYDLVRKTELGSISTPIGEWMLRGTPWAFGALASGSLLVELGAPLALLHRGVGRIWAIASWAFHLGVLAVMAIAFVYPLSGIAFAPFFHCERAVRRLPGLRHLAAWLNGPR